MLWGLVPPWHHGAVATTHKLTTNNARLEGLRDSKLYKPVLEKDRRCVIVCDGFYEWKTKAGEKQPYLVYAAQKNPLFENVQEFSKASISQHWSEEDGDSGPRPLFMAGLYSIWQPDDDKKKLVFNYTVITR